jgi:hypothetical protein
VTSRWPAPSRGRAQILSVVLVVFLLYAPTTASPSAGYGQSVRTGTAQSNAPRPRARTRGGHTQTHTTRTCTHPETRDGPRHGVRRTADAGGGSARLAPTASHTGLPGASLASGGGMCTRITQIHDGSSADPRMSTPHAIRGVCGPRDAETLPVPLREGAGAFASPMCALPHERRGRGRGRGRPDTICGVPVRGRRAYLEDGMGAQEAPPPPPSPCSTRARQCSRLAPARIS